MPINQLPSLEEFGYQPIRFLETDSKMSSILLAKDADERWVVLKIARVEQAVRADVNRQAIHNTVEWLTTLGTHPGIGGLYPIAKSQDKERGYLARLHHWQGEPEFLAMEYLAGGSLRDYVSPQRLPLVLALQIAYGVAQALAFIHQQGCVHRDLKPENILFRSPLVFRLSRGRQTNLPLPILIDFGVAARQGESRFVSGSRLWMAPELQQAYERTPLPVDPSWDIYALGLIVCSMVSGLLPSRRNSDAVSYAHFQHRAMTSLEREICDRTATDNRPLDLLKQLLDKALARDPEVRPTASEFAQAVATILEHMHAPLPVGEAVLPRFAPWRRLLLATKPWQRIGIFLALISLLVAIIWALLTLNQQLTLSDQQSTERTLQPAQTPLVEIERQSSSPTLEITVTASASPSTMPPTLVQPLSNDTAPTLVPTPLANRATVVRTAPTLLPQSQ